ncbi:hypothetical protein C9374_007289 [Naegleria lovaniensis]|uniref:Uncharacterized protein n=1 Tax=Naegleria lovaniensis TaxID=51637 RepID=A0AA88KQ07_NAELO|nr:uncharacterized protein C9374_007289 [Naegleria lovaniensis]KAG2393758.1 hypothetical protein C9374_007289 [Naegleria lovaniensis]
MKPLANGILLSSATHHHLNSVTALQIGTRAVKRILRDDDRRRGICNMSLKSDGNYFHQSTTKASYHTSMSHRTSKSENNFRPGLLNHAVVDESIIKWTQQQLQNLIIQIYKWRGLGTQQQVVASSSEPLNNTIDSIMSEAKRILSQTDAAEDLYPQLVALQIAAQYIKEHELPRPADKQQQNSSENNAAMKIGEVSKLSFSTSKLQSIVKKKTDFSTLNTSNSSEASIRELKEHIVKYLNEMNGVFSLLQCWSLSKIILQKLLYFQNDMTSLSMTKQTIEEFLKSGKTENLVTRFFGTYFQLAAIYERENQFKNAAGTLLALLPKLEDSLSALNELNTATTHTSAPSKDALAKYISSIQQYIRDVHKRLSVLLEKLHDYTSAAKHLKALLPQDSNGVIQLPTNEKGAFGELKTQLLKLAYLHTMATEWKSADVCYEDATLLTARQLSSLTASTDKITSHQIVLDSLIVSYEWTIFLRKMLLILQHAEETETNEKETTDEDSETKDQKLDIPSRLQTIKRLLDIGTNIGKGLGILSEELPNIENLQNSSHLVHFLKEKVEVQTFNELAKLQLAFIKSFLMEGANGNWDDFSAVWDNLLMAMNHVLTMETKILNDEYYQKLEPQLSRHFHTFKDAIINEGLHLLGYCIARMRHSPNHNLNSNQQFEAFYENLLVILSRNEKCFENQFKTWTQLRSLMGSYALYRRDINPSIELSRYFVEKQVILDTLTLAPNDSSNSLPFRLYDVLVEVFEKDELAADSTSSETATTVRNSVYKRAYRILAPTKEIAIEKSLQFENWVIEGKHVIEEAEIYQVDMDRCVEHNEKTTLQFLQDLMKEEPDASEYLFAGIVNASGVYKP